MPSSFGVVIFVRYFWKKIKDVCIANTASEVFPCSHVIGHEDEKGSIVFFPPLDAVVEAFLLVVVAVWWIGHQRIMCRYGLFRNVLVKVSSFVVDLGKSQFVEEQNSSSIAIVGIVNSVLCSTGLHNVKNPANVLVGLTWSFEMIIVICLVGILFGGPRSLWS